MKRKVEAVLSPAAGEAQGSGSSAPKRQTTLAGTAPRLRADLGQRDRTVTVQDRFLQAVKAKADKSKLSDLIQNSNVSDLINLVSHAHIEEGRTPLAYAVQRNHERVARDLISLKANVNLVMGNSTTALTLAASNKRRDGTAMVRLLLSKGADPAALGRAGVDKLKLNPTMRYWIARAESIRPQSTEELAHLAKTPPMEKMQEIQYALIGQSIAVGMVKRALCMRFANPQGRRSPLVLLLLGPPGHGKTCIARNLAKSLVGEENYTEVACGALRDDADLFGSRLGGAVGGTYSSDGRLVQFLRARQTKDTMVFLDEFEKIKGLTSALGWDQAKKMYQAFLEPWQEGTLSDVGAGSTPGKIDCKKAVWILTSNWGQKEILDFAEEHTGRVNKKMDDSDMEWVQRELIDKRLVPLVLRELKGVHADVQALARRINCTIPFLPFTESERAVVADTELRHRFQLYREPAVLEEESDESKRRTYGNLHLRHTEAFCKYAATRYNAMEGADSMTRVADEVDGLFLSMVIDRKLELSHGAMRRMQSNKPPGTEGDVAEPQFWAHYDVKAERVSITQKEPPVEPDVVEVESSDSQAGETHRYSVEADVTGTLDAEDNPFDD